MKHNFNFTFSILSFYLIKNTLSDQNQCIEQGGKFIQPATNLDCATTTRYWDCAGGACGCGGCKVKNACSFGSVDGPFICGWNQFGEIQLTQEDKDRGIKYYTTSAPSRPLFGSGSWLGTGCGECYELTSTGYNPYNESAELKSQGVKIITMITNFCPSSNWEWCPDSGKNKYNAYYHFDIAMPGAGEGNQAHCSEQFSVNSEYQKDAFEQYITTWQTGQKCQDLPKMLQCGCQKATHMANQTNWNNPIVTFQKIQCPIPLQNMYDSQCWFNDNWDDRTNCKMASDLSDPGTCTLANFGNSTTNENYTDGNATITNTTQENNISYWDKIPDSQQCDCQINSIQQSLNQTDFDTKEKCLNEFCQNTVAKIIYYSKKNSQPCDCEQVSQQTQYKIFDQCIQNECTINIQNQTQITQEKNQKNQLQVQECNEFPLWIWILIAILSSCCVIFSIMWAYQFSKNRRKKTMVKRPQRNYSKGYTNQTYQQSQNGQYQESENVEEVYSIANTRYAQEYN